MIDILPPDLDQDTRETLETILEALEDKKAMDPVLIDVRGVSSVTDWIIIVSGTSQPHLRALFRSADTALRESGSMPTGADLADGSGWAVIDTIDIMVHILTDEQRAFYNLERLWADGQSKGLKAF